MPKAPPLLPCFVRTLFERFDPHVCAAQNPNAREPTLRRGSGNSAALRPLPPRASPFFSTFRLFFHTMCVAALCHPCYVCAPRTACELMAEHSGERWAIADPGPAMHKGKCCQQYASTIHETYDAYPGKQVNGQQGHAEGGCIKLTGGQTRGRQPNPPRRQRRSRVPLDSPHAKPFAAAHSCHSCQGACCPTRTSRAPTHGTAPSQAARGTQHPEAGPVVLLLHARCLRCCACASFTGASPQ